MQYKVIIHGNNMYKEISLDESFNRNLLIGTENGCHIMFSKDKFDLPFILRIDREETGKFILSCSENVYLKGSQGLMEYVRYLAIGDYVDICYGDSNKEFFRIEFFIEYERVGKDYDFQIDCRSRNEIIIGCDANCTIRIDNPILNNESIKLAPTGNGDYLVDISNTQYDVFVNGMIPRTNNIRIRNGEFISLKGYSFCFEDGYVYTSKNAGIITNCPIKKMVYQKNHFEYPKFVRNVRQKYKTPEEKIEVLDPESKDENEEQSFLMTVMPMLVNMLLMVGLRGMMGGGGMFVIYFAATMTVSTTITIINFVKQKKGREKTENRRKEVYMKYLQKREDEIIKLREREKVVANVMNPSLVEYAGFIEDFNNRLFEKDVDDEDYLSVRLGSGIVASNCQVDCKEEEYVDTTDDLKDFPKAIHDKYMYLDEMPVILELKESNAVGFVGSRSKLYQMTKNLIIEFAASHFYKTTKIFLIMDEGDVDMFSWARWFQITYNERTGGRNFMYDKDSEKITLEYLYSELSSRETVGKDAIFPENYVVLVYKSDVLSNHPVSKYIENANQYGFHFVFFEEFEEKLNPNCEARIFLNERENTGYVQKVDDGENIQHFTYQHIDKAKAVQLATKLAPVYIDEVNLENTLTKNITLFQLLSIQSPYDLDLSKRWSESKIYESMAAPLGVKSGDETVCLDLHEKFHGPHGLVAGTTGSGKSEIMQSYILSMATLFHPYEVGFVIIDFKGGGMVNQFRDLPHLNGAITNIDGNEIERSLLSIKAELMKRQELFAEQNVNHIDDYIRAFKEGKAKTPLPHLILIVDEFAELKADQPEFMQQLISTARIGRSLGIHLILATQKPAGVVSDQIWSNSKFKLCLKVQNKNDSNEVLKSPLAAEITEPGRAYLQVGNNEIFQLFQSAYSGAPAQTSGINEQKKFSLMSVELSGRRKIIYEQKPKKTEGGDSQLKSIVDYVNEYCQKSGIKKLQNICLPSLSEAIPFTVDNCKYDGTDIVIPIGIVDDPSRQKQYEEVLNISQNNLYVLGASQSGKTNLIQTMIRGLAERYSPKDVNIYILDFASMILKNFETLNHVGGVITSSDEERLKGFLKLMQSTIQMRKKYFSELGLSSYSAYREAGKTELPQIVVFLDNWVAFRGYFPDYEDTIINISRDSVSVGISLVVTAGQANGAGFKLLSNFAKRTALYCNDSSDYGVIFEACRKKINNIAGRGIVENNKTYYEIQYYLAFAAEKEFEKINLMREFIGKIHDKYGEVYVAGIPEIPQTVTEAYMNKQFGADYLPYEVPLGMEFNTIGKRTISLDKTFLQGFVGPKVGAKHNYLVYLINRLIQNNEKAPVSINIIDDAEAEFKMFADKVDGYTQSIPGMIQIVTNIFEILKERSEKVKAGQLNLASEPLQVILINSFNLMKAFGTDKTLVEILKLMTTSLKSLKICFLLTDVENNMISFTAGDLLKLAKDTKNYIIFEEIKNVKVTDVPMSASREFKKPLDKDDAYVFKGESIEKIRTVAK